MPANKRHGPDLATGRAHDRPLLEREVALAHVRPGLADVLAGRDLRERLDLELLAVRVARVQPRVLDHEHRVRARGQRRAGVDAEDVLGRDWFREFVRARRENLVDAGRVGRCIDGMRTVSLWLK